MRRRHSPSNYCWTEGLSVRRSTVRRSTAIVITGRGSTTHYQSDWQTSGFSVERRQLLTTNNYTRMCFTAAPQLIDSYHINPLTTSTVAIWVQLRIKDPVPDRATPSFIIFDIRHSDTRGWASECPSNITNDDLTRSGTVCFIAVPIWQQWTSND